MIGKIGLSIFIAAVIITASGLYKINAWLVILSLGMAILGIILVFISLALHAEHYRLEHYGTKR